MNSIPAYIVTDESITVVVSGKPYTISKSNASFNEVKNRIVTQNFVGIEQLFSPAAAVASFTKGNVSLKNGQVLFKGQVVHNYVVDKILAFVREGLPYQPLLNFLENLLQNPSFRAVSELYGFLEYAKLPLTEDGCFLAYRKVTNDHKDFYTGSFDNSVGATCEMPRNQVDEDANRTCSKGLHFCSQAYLSQYHGGQGRVVIVKINPADVVAIPTDYNNTKGRCCKYVVLSDCEGAEAGQQFGALYQTTPKVTIVEDVQDISESRDLGYDAGEQDAVANVVRDAKLAFEDENFLEDLNEAAFTEGYHKGYDETYVAPKNVVPMVSVDGVRTGAVRQISEATRQKLRDAALRQKRNASGQYV